MLFFMQYDVGKCSWGSNCMNFYKMINKSSQ